MDVEKSSRSVAVSDVALAADRIRLVAGPRGMEDSIKVLWERAFRLLASRNPKWTRRRVRAIWNGEAARIDHREIAEMEAVIALKDARRQHAAFVAETARMATFLATQDEAFHSPEIERLRSLASSVDRAGAGGK